MIPPFRSGCKTDVGTDPRGRWTFGGLVAMLGGVAGAASFGDARLEISFDDRTGAATHVADGRLDSPHRLDVPYAVMGAIPIGTSIWEVTGPVPI